MPFTTATRMPVIKLLLEAGADVNAGGGRMPLEAALVAGKWEIAEFLVANGADVNGLARTGQRLLEYAKSLTNAKRMIDFLQDHGAADLLGQWEGVSPMLMN